MTDARNDSLRTGENDELVADVFADNGAGTDAGGALRITRVNGEAALVGASVGDASTGFFTLDAAGRLTFDPAGAYDHLTADETAVVSLTYEVTDELGEADTATVTVTVEGANDAAVFGGDLAATVIEDEGVFFSGLFTTGSVTVGDADAGEAWFETGTVTSAAGTATVRLMQSGEGRADWAFDGDPTNAAYQHLGAGIAMDEVFTLRAVDGTETTLVVTVIGTNDAAVIGGSFAASVLADPRSAEGGTLSYTATGSVTVDDIDEGEAVIVRASALSVLGAPVSLSEGPEPGTAVWTVQLESGTEAFGAVQALAAGSTLEDSFVLTTADGTAQRIDLLFEGRNDAPVALGDSLDVAVGTTAGLDLLANDADPDLGDALSVVSVGGAAIEVGETLVLASGAAVTLGADGLLQFDQRGMYDALLAGESVVEAVAYEVADLSGALSSATATFTVLGDVSLPVLGTDADDVMTGTAYDDELDAGAGDDLLIGAEGSDVLHGGAGADVIYGDG